MPLELSCLGGTLSLFPRERPLSALVTRGAFLAMARYQPTELDQFLWCVHDGYLPIIFFLSFCILILQMFLSSFIYKIQLGFVFLVPLIIFFCLSLTLVVCLFTGIIDTLGLTFMILFALYFPCLFCYFFSLSMLSFGLVFKNFTLPPYLFPIFCLLLFYSLSYRLWYASFTC